MFYEINIHLLINIEDIYFSNGLNKIGTERLCTTVVKECDQTTPVLYHAVCEGRTLKKTTIKMYRILESGIESEYFNT